MWRYYSNKSLRNLSFTRYIFQLMSNSLIDEDRWPIWRRMVMIVRSLILLMLLLLHVIKLRFFFSLMEDWLILLNLLDLVLIFNFLLNFITGNRTLMDFRSFGRTSSASFKYFRRKRVFLYDVLLGCLFRFWWTQFAYLPHSFSNLTLGNLRVF